MFLNCIFAFWRIYESESTTRRRGPASAAVVEVRFGIIIACASVMASTPF